jgi:hypothetical protein
VTHLSAGNEIHGLQNCNKTRCLKPRSKVSKG